EPAPRQASRANKPVLDFDVLDVEHVLSRKFGEQVHAKLGHQIVSRADRHVPHSGPNCDQPGLVQLELFGHLASSFAVSPVEPDHAVLTAAPRTRCPTIIDRSDSESYVPT